MTDTPLIILDIDAAGMAVRIAFNDVPILDEPLFERTNKSAKVNGWALTGANTIAIAIGGLPARPPHVPPAPPGALPAPRCEVRLRWAMPGPDTSHDRVLFEYEWAGGTRPAGPLQQATSRTIALSVPFAWAWTRGQAVAQPSDADRGGIGSLLQRLEAALARRDVAAVVQLQSLSIREQAQALGIESAGALEGYAAFLRGRMGSGWKVLPLAGAGLTYHPVAGERVLHVKGPGGHPPIITESGDGEFSIDPYVALIDGHWQIVR